MSLIGNVSCRVCGVSVEVRPLTLGAQGAMCKNGHWSVYCGDRKPMTTEPDRPRRDVSIEEAERMPMGEGELDAIEARAKGVPYSGIPVTPEEQLALIAEVRRLRAHYHERQTQVDKLAAEVEVLKKNLDWWRNHERIM